MEGARGASSNAAKHKKGKSPMQIWRPITTEAKSPVQRWRPISTEAVPRKGEMSVEVTGVNEDRHGSNISEKHSSSVEVDASLMPFLKGKGGSTQKQIEQETGVKIILPSSKEETLVGKSPESNIKTSERIAKDSEEAAKKTNTHFISLPLAIHPDLVEKLNQFQSSILGASASNVHSDFSIDKSIFINPKTFHLTVLMLKLWNEDRIAMASDVLRSISSQVNEALEKRLISIQLRGLACIKGSEEKAQVVYAPVLEVGGEGRLTHACKVIIDAFVKSGLVPVEDAKQELKLHATVMNVRHRKSKKYNDGNDSFDARSIFSIYREQEWGEYPIREVHLSQRFKYDVSGYYHCCCSIPLPEEM